MTLYKYLTLDRSDIFETEHIRYTQPVYLNDPFEMIPDFSEVFSERSFRKAVTGKFRRDAINELIARYPENIRWKARLFIWIFLLLQGRQLKQNMHTLIATFTAKMRVELPEIIESKIRASVGVLSLSAKPDNLQMWSHYAKNHTGFVLAVDEKHSVFDERRSSEDELNYLRKVLYSQKKVKPTLKEVSGVDLLLRKSLEWQHEDEWRIIKQLDAATAISMRNRDAYLYPLPADAIQGVIFGAHMAENERKRITDMMHSRPSFNHVWMRQAEVSRTEFQLKFFKLPGVVERYDIPTAQFQFVDVPEERRREIADIFNAVATMAASQPLNLSRLKTAHISPNILETVSDFLKKPTGGNTTGQVFGLSTGSDVDIVMFLTSSLFNLGPPITADETKPVIHELHKQFAHVHNVTARFHALGEEALTEMKPGTAGYLGPVALNIWNDYAVSRLSAGTFPSSEAVKIIPNLVKLRDDCSSAVAQAIAEYQVHRNLNQLMVFAAIRIQTFACALSSALGYADGIDTALGDTIDHAVSTVGGKNYEIILRDLRRALRRMFRYYPEWEDFSIYDDLMYVTRMIAFQWGLPMRDRGKKIHVAIMR